MIGNKETCEKNFSYSSTNNDQITRDTKIQRIVKTLLIDISFVAMVSNIRVKKYHQLLYF